MIELPERSALRSFGESTVPPSGEKLPGAFFFFGGGGVSQESRANEAHP